MRGTHVSSFFFVVIVGAACGGASQSDLLGSGSGPGGGDAGGSDDAGNGTDTGGGQDSGHKDSGGQDSGGPVDSGGDDTGTQDTGVPDTGTSGEPEVFCAKPGDPPAFCGLPKDYCCVTTGVNGKDYKCAPQGSTCAGSAVHCDDSADCPGQICCGTLNNPNQANAYYSEVSCRNDCNAQTQTYVDIQFCDPQVPGQCLQGQCKPSTVLPGYDVCY